MSSSLFRKEALEHHKDRLYGDVILLQPLSITILVSAVVFICTLILIVLFWGSYARKESVRGYLIPDKGIVKLYAPQQGTVQKILVQEGDDVNQSQVLLSILSQRTLEGGSDIETTMLQELEETKKQQFERIEGEKSLVTSETQRLNEKIKSLQKELAQIESSIKTQESRLKILEKRVAGAKKLLENKNISEIDYNRLYEELLEQQQKYQDLLRANGATLSNLAQTKTELEQLPIRSKARVSEIQNKISDLNQHIAEVSGRRTGEIRAPVAGVITALQITEGQTKGQGELLLEIVPKESVFQVELFVPSRAIGFIARDQVVRIRYDAFPYQRFGIYEGKVANISKHILLPKELPVPLELKEPVYRVVVNLKQQHVNAYGKAFPLQAGMSLEADIVLEKQTLWKWIFDPLFSLKGRF